MGALKRIDEGVFFEIFNRISKNRNRVSLKRALSELKTFFNSPKNPHLKLIDDFKAKSSQNDTSDNKNAMTRPSDAGSLSEDFMDEFYARGVDRRHGLRSQVLMVGGPKCIRGNPRGSMDPPLFFPYITFEQFFGIAKDIECAYIEKLVPHASNNRVTRTYTTGEFVKYQTNLNKNITKMLQSSLK
ncbi:conserved hypothetical protein [Theileria equi strain WA]|uniref:Uncharacterized protein n=1 Tax=Theileria equi strain WA TaxID=1537102 RepID=L1LCW0_THEEQ|nr:conserved hypothetical protein [Theileria equi strain WA]EKX73090.1 conserved hypothetical protein [Theileria equi strain WA]|eukprot:XP_004832542.1 conserved hypothetical protein [Theileria equi strain WA]